MPKLKRDYEVKNAFAKAAKVEWLDVDRRSAGATFDKARLREILIASPEAQERYGKLKSETRFPGPWPHDGDDLLAAEVVEFCPVPYPIWQENAREVLLEHVGEWRRSLASLKQAVRRTQVYSVPFAAFLLPDDPGGWVSNVEACVVAREEFLMDSDDPGVETIYYYRRPFISWPVRESGSPEHVTVLPDEQELTIMRPDLRNWRLGDAPRPTATRESHKR